MDFRALIIAVRTRLLADNGAGGLTTLATGVYGMMGTSDASYPFCVIDIAGSGSEDGFTLNMAEVRFRVHTFAEIDNGFSALNAITQRIYGDGNQTPAYGLHRHAISLSGGWVATAVQWVTRSIDMDHDHYHAVDEFVTYMNKAAA